MTKDERREAEYRLRRNSQETRVYKRAAFDDTTNMALIEAEMIVDYSCELMSDVIERPHLGYTKANARQSMIYDLGRTLRKARRLQALGR
jgi:hypothetical protein